MKFMTRGLIFMMACHVTFVLLSQGADILTSSDGRFRYKYLGCYNDKSDRTLPIELLNGRKYVDWNIKDYNFEKIIDMCATQAYDRGYLKLFGLQYYGECWGGRKGSHYNIYGEAKTSKCMKGIGKGWTNAVYEIIYDCKVSGMTYGSGQRFYIPQNPVNSNDISCQSCLCDQGYKSCRGKITCDFFFPCEKFIPAPPGTCCPTCACYHQNKFYKDGQSWIIRQPHAGPDCYECTCASNQTKCVAVGCPNYCQNPVYEPDKCCPTCHPGAPTSHAPFTIPETTFRPPPVMPPFPGFPGNQKRSLRLRKISKRSKS